MPTGNYTIQDILRTIVSQLWSDYIHMMILWSVLTSMSYLNSPRTTNFISIYCTYEVYVLRIDGQDPILSLEEKHRSLKDFLHLFSSLTWSKQLTLQPTNNNMWANGYTNCAGTAIASGREGKCFLMPPAPVHVKPSVMILHATGGCMVFTPGGPQWVSRG